MELSRTVSPNLTNPDLRKTSYGALVLIFSIAYGFLYFGRTSYSSGQLVFGVLNTLIQLLLDIAIVILAGRTLSHRHFGQFSKLVAIGAAVSATCGVLYGTCVQVLKITEFDGTSLEIVINGLYLSFLFLGTLALRSLSRDRMTGALLTSVAVAVVFYLLVGHRISEVLPVAQTRIIHFICLIAESLLIAHAMNQLLNNDESGVRFVAAGFVCIALFGFLLQSIELSSGLKVGLPLELLWTGAQLLFVSGFRKLSDKQSTSRQGSQPAKNSTRG